MALDRQSIEKKDFPIGRRGYDPDAVDAHLSAVAEQVEDLKSSARRRAESLADTASEQVRMIIEAAENSANQIRADAEKDARDIRREARTEAKQTREEATSQAGQYVANVSSATSSMTERLDTIEQELGNLLDSLRTSVTRASSDLQLLENHLVEVRDAVSPRPQFELEEEPEPAPSLGATSAPSLGYAEPEPEPQLEPEALPEEELVYEQETTTLEDFLPQADAAETDSLETVPAESEGDFADDTEGARLIALNMALNGTPREEVDRYLAENFELSDRAGLIEEVYSSVEG